MQRYRVGQIVDNFKNHHEGAYFDISDEGATLLVFFKNPTSSEIDQFKTGQYFEIRFIELYEIIMITVKIGDLNWMDAPYTPHLSFYLTELQLPKVNQGLALSLFLIDAASGEIKHMRLIGLSEEFTIQLFKTIIENRNKPFDEKNTTILLMEFFPSILPNKL